MGDFSWKRFGRLSKRYSYFYNGLNVPRTFNFGVEIDCSSDDESDVLEISSDDESDVDNFEEIQPSQSLDESMSAIDTESIE